MDEMEQFKATFFAECTELLADLETQLAALQDGATDSETLNAIFRAVHSIKAGAGAFKLTALVEFSHRFEALLDCLRDGRVPVIDAVVGVLFRANDILADLVDAAISGNEPKPGLGSDVAAELEALTQTARGEEATATAASDGAPAADDDDGEQAPVRQRYRISFMPVAAMFQHANEPLLIIRELQDLGEVTVTASLDRLPDLHRMDPEDAYLSWTIEVVTDRGEEAVREAFEFVVDDCALSIDCEKPEDEPVGVPVAASPVQGAGRPEPATEAAAADGNGQARRPGQGGSIRVDLDRVDRLVNMVGELVITQSMLNQQASDLPSERFVSIVRGLEELALHTRELQESVMAIRMQPVKSVFSRMPRIVRELSSKLGKKVQLVTAGETTEVDKTVIEEISDPITHMIRNALDHGLEGEEERRAAGKDPEGTIRLSAEHRSGRIVISIQDDGRGINRDKVLEKARANGVVGAEQVPSNEEIDNLIFAPGFSTAAEVTDVSGRGVGMDVVKRNVQALGGRIAIQNNPGQGTLFTMTLPLTLAVMDGMIVSVGGEKYVIPITSIVECLRPLAKDVRRLPGGREVISVRGDYIPLVHLSRAFSLPNAISDPSKALVVLVDSDVDGRVGIVVDELLGQQQVVIKSLEANYDPVQGISGATILGNGRVAAILDIEGLCVLDDLADFDPADLGVEGRPAGPRAVDPQPGQQQLEATL